MYLLQFSSFTVPSFHGPRACLLPARPRPGLQELCNKRPFVPHMPPVRFQRGHFPSVLVLLFSWLPCRRLPFFTEANFSVSSFMVFVSCLERLSSCQD